MTAGEFSGGKINFGGETIHEQAADGFDIVKADVDDGALTEPEAQDEALLGDGQFVEFFDGELFGGGKWEAKRLEPVGLGAADFGGAPECLGSVLAEIFLEIGNELAANAIAEELGIAIGGVLAPIDFMTPGISDDFAAPDGEPGAMDGERAAPGDGAHTGARAGTAQELEEKGLDLIVGVMREDKVTAVETCGGFFKKNPTRSAGISLGAREVARSARDDESKLIFFGETRDKAFLGIALGTPAMIKVEDDRIFSGGDEGMEQSAGIDSAGDSEEKFFRQCVERVEEVVGRKFLG